MTPLKRARIARGWTLIYLSARLASIGEQVDSGNLSRLERGVQRASTSLAEHLSTVFDGEINEMHILYPERFAEASEKTQTAA